MSLDLFECLSLSEGGPATGPRVDREKGIIFGVKVLGWKSLNGREYDPAGVDPKMYEGRAVCADHIKPGQTRSTRDTVGWLKGCTKDVSPAGGIYAEQFRLLNPRGEYEQKVMTAADEAPHLFGLSHFAKGREKVGSGGAYISAVEHVETVDLVRDPATVAGLYESRAYPVKQKLKDLAETLKKRRSGFGFALLEMAEAGVMSPDAEAAAPASDTDSDHAQAFVGGVVEAINKVLQAAISNGDWDAAMDQVNAYVKTIKKHLGKKDNGNGGSAAEPPADAPAATESRRLKDENATLLAEKLVRRAAGKASLTLSETLVEAVARPGMTEAQADAVIAELKGAGASGGSQRPRSAEPIVPPRQAKSGAKPVTEGKAEIPAGVKDRAEWLKRG